MPTGVSMHRGTNLANLDENSGHNRYISALNRRGFGLAQVEQQVNDLRLKIQQYLESFAPIP